MKIFSNETKAEVGEGDHGVVVTTGGLLKKGDSIFSKERPALRLQFGSVEFSWHSDKNNGLMYEALDEDGFDEMDLDQAKAIFKQLKTGLVSSDKKHIITSIAITSKTKIIDAK